MDETSLLQPWIPFAVSLGCLVIVHRVATHLIIAFFYRITRSVNLSMLLYALVVWPGTVLHEVAHWLVARLLGVYAELPHLLPSKPDEKGRMVLGHVMVERSDVVRRSLIGVAPLVAGSAAVAGLARYAFALPLPQLEVAGVGSLVPLLDSLPSVFAVPDAWIYLYALFAIANAMMPSPSDREAWPSLLLFLALIGTLFVGIVGIPQVPEPVAQWGVQLLAWLTFAFVITIVLNLGLLLILFPAERLLRWMRG